ncbi:MAG: NAD(P)/FAD-dependent oxidoreductase [Erysipelotrichaceae bacterium]|nr:NAD(P)/FAD-dependent oxidoreductase [Erysipelotrichaceae bacterium]
MYDIIIIGAGVTGSFIARELARYKLNVLVLEKDFDVGNETTAANSAIVHSGYDPVPGTLKAKLNVEGNKMFDKVCDELDVSFKRIGSITVALDEAQMETLKALQERAKENGVETILLNREELLEKEPMLQKEVIGGLLAPTAGIIDPFNLCVHLMENAIDNGVTLKLNEEVTKIVKEDGLFVVNDQYKAKVVINATGVMGDIVNELVNDKTFDIMPRKGQYYVFDHFKRPFVSHTLFMVPSDKGKGVLITPTTSGNYLVGPSANLVARDEKSTDKQTLNNVRAQANNVIENIPYYETIRTFAGLRATPSTHDFIIEESETENFINVVGIESPGLASSPAIAKMVIDEIISKKFDLVEKEDYNPRVRRYVKLKNLSIEERQEYFKSNKDYGTIVCKCEQVSKGEIIDCLNRSCPPHSIKALKRRLRVGFGKCQGGMCQSVALEILAAHYGLDKKEIPYDGPKAFILLKKTKGEE